MIYLMWCCSILVVVLLVFLVIVSLQPGSFRVERTRVIPASPEVVFGMINDFHRWTAWSPWEKIDPDLKRTYAGAESGVGAIYSWVGNKQVGEGRMTILENKPAELIRIKLEFLKPFAATNEATFTFTPEGGGTKVVWAMVGKKNFMMKGFCMFMNMDSMVGKDFEKGLGNMETAVKAG